MPERPIGLRASRFRSGVLGFVLALSVCSSAYAIDLSSLSQVYLETYDELAFPLTPEVDLLGLGGMFGILQLQAIPPALTGSAAHIVLGAGVENAGITYTNPGVQSTAAGTEDVGLRGSFDSIVFGSDGVADFVVSAGFAPTVETDTLVQAGIELTLTSGNASANLLVTESTGLIAGGLANSTSLPLTNAAANAVLAGGAFTVDLLVDRTGSTAIGSVDVDGVGVFTSAPIPLTVVGSETFVYAFQATAAYDTPPSTVDVNHDNFEIYSVAPDPYQPAFNIDISSIRGIPSSSYAAAGFAGVWDAVSLGANSGLLDTDGVATPVSATLTGESEEQSVGLGPYPLLADFVSDCTDPKAWSIAFANLTNASYRVRIYAAGVYILESPQLTDPLSGDMDVNGMPVAGLTHTGGSLLTEGYNYVTVITDVVDGSLVISGLLTDGDPSRCAGIAGVQLEQGPLLPPTTVPGLRPQWLIVLGLLIAATGFWALRPRRFGR
jgi:hypothetical protein